MLWLQETLLLGVGVALSSLGILTLHAIHPTLALRQGMWLGLGLGVYAGMRRLSPRTLRRLFWVGYGIHLGLLVLTHLIGDGPVRRWIVMGPVAYQPSEGMKALLILLLPPFLLRSYLDALLRGAVLVGIPLLLVLLQPDLATAGVMGLIALVQGFLAGVSARILLPLVSLPFLLLTVVAPWVFWGILGVGSAFILVASLGRAYWLFYVLILTVAGVLTPLAWNRGLKPYQRERIVRFLRPSDPQAAWQSYQAEIAVGSGGLWGKGYGRGTQRSLRFLPAAHTDFIFSSFAEEWGFVGGSVVLLAFFLLIWNVMGWGASLPQLQDRLVVYGVAAYFFLHAFLNLGMNLRILPVAGLPLPFMSYGGSHLLTDFALLGVAVSHFRATWKR